MVQSLWHKSQILLTSVFFNFGRKKIENLSFKNGHFTTISGHLFGNYINIFHKTEIQTVILRCLVCKNCNWIKSCNIILIKIFFLSCLKMDHFRASLPKWFLTPQKETSSCVFKMGIFSRFFWALMRFVFPSYKPHNHTNPKRAI